MNIKIRGENPQAIKKSKYEHIDIKNVTVVELLMSPYRMSWRGFSSGTSDTILM